VEWVKVHKIFRQNKAEKKIKKRGLGLKEICEDFNGSPHFYHKKG